jgi:hypothetical protein
MKNFWSGRDAFETISASGVEAFVETWCSAQTVLMAGTKWTDHVDDIRLACCPSDRSLRKRMSEPRHPRRTDEEWQVGFLAHHRPSGVAFLYVDQDAGAEKDMIEGASVQIES